MATVPSKGLLGLLKRGWIEMPDMVGCAFMSLLGLGIGVSGLFYYYANDLDNRKYKVEYTVVRPDDPRAARIRKD